MYGFEFRGLLVAGLLGTGLLGTGASNAAAVPLSFPAEQHLIPVVVGAAFVMPALAALAYATLGRLGRRLGPIAGVALLAGAALAIAGFMQPSLIPFRGS